MNQENTTASHVFNSEDMLNEPIGYIHFMLSDCRSSDMLPSGADPISSISISKTLKGTAKKSKKGNKKDLISVIS